MKRRTKKKRFEFTVSRDGKTKRMTTPRGGRPLWTLRGGVFRKSFNDVAPGDMVVYVPKSERIADGPRENMRLGLIHELLPVIAEASA